ncbi:MAG TPA: L,D-transpeptidase family protein [Longimicrobiales bacterium]|nr:L,D-transpeptidase family protein [Longimicrobiales bacterium]
MALLGIAAAPGQAQLAREQRPLGEPAAPLGSPALPTETEFALSQMQNQRVLDARIATRFNIKRLFEERGIRYPAAEMFIRIFKRERTLELWVRSDENPSFQLLKKYDICALAGELGPKRQQGDSQVPEGFYAVDFFNPQSDYHLSLHVDYPNVKDRSAADGINLGGDIYIHGGCNSDGCLAVTDEGIMELYWMAVEARAAGQERIPVHIFPARLEADELQRLQRAFANDPALGTFWSTLKPGYDFFEQNQRIPAIKVDGNGDYVLVGEAENASVRVTAVDAAPDAEPRGTAEPKRPAPLGSPSSGN